MSREEFTDELDELIAAGRDGGLSRRGYDRAPGAGDQGAARGAVVASGARLIRSAVAGSSRTASIAEPNLSQGILTIVEGL